MRVLTETALELSLHVLCDLVVEVGRGAAVALLVQVLQDRIIYILLRGCEVVEVDAAPTGRVPLALPQVVARAARVARTRSMSTVHAL